jgi:hypothetical protein
MELTAGNKKKLIRKEKEYITFVRNHQYLHDYNAEYSLNIISILAP